MPAGGVGLRLQLTLKVLLGVLLTERRICVTVAIRWGITYVTAILARWTSWCVALQLRAATKFTPSLAKRFINIAWRTSGGKAWEGVAESSPGSTH